MNERIEEFYSQVGLDFENFQRVTVKKGDMEKFAELIVLECAGIAYEYDAPKMSGPGMIIAGRIETHFGVEE